MGARTETGQKCYTNGRSSRFPVLTAAAIVSGPTAITSLTTALPERLWLYCRTIDAQEEHRRVGEFYVCLHGEVTVRQVLLLFPDGLPPNVARKRGSRPVSEGRHQGGDYRR